MPSTPGPRWHWWDPLQRAAFLWPLAGVPVFVLICLLVPFRDPCNAWPLAGLIIVLTPILISWDWGRARLHDRLHRHDYRLCLRCGYQLDGLPDEGTCPECAEPYNPRLVQESWRKRIGLDEMQAKSKGNDSS